MLLGFGAAAALAQAPGGGTNAARPDGTAQPGNLDRSNGLDSKGGPAAGSAQASYLDKAFLREATQGSNFEIQLAQLALQKTSADDVKQFAHMMVTDHTRLNEQMKPVAADAGVTPPSGISTKDKALYAKLQALNGDAFDRAYIEDMVKDHTEDLKAFKNEAQNGQLPSETKAAAAGAQVVSTHLAAAKQLAQAHRVS